MLRDIAIFHQSVQPNGNIPDIDLIFVLNRAQKGTILPPRNSVVFAVSSPCSENNGGCEQLCFSFPNRTEPKCQCATGVLDKNGKSCNGIFLFYHILL